MLCGKSVGLKYAKGERGILGRGNRVSKGLGAGKWEEHGGRSTLDSSDG